METWPSVLPLPKLDEYSGGNDPTVTRTDMASGRPRQRRRFTTDWRVLNVMWRLTDIQFAIFQSFVYRRLSGGADWFTISLRVGGGGLQEYNARFVEGKYSHQQLDLGFDVTAIIELDDPKYVSDEDLDALIAIGGDLDALEAVAEELHIYATT